MTLEYVTAPTSVSFSEMAAKNASLSPSTYRDVIIPAKKTCTVSQLLNPKKPFWKGVEPGSVHYLKESTHYMIRTKALQRHTSLVYPKGDAIIPINPRAFSCPGLNPGDIILSKDSNVGECAIIIEDRWAKFMFSGGIVRLNPICDRYYLFAFLKHSFFPEQVISKCPRGATIRHAKSVWLDCRIPFPSQRDEMGVIRYVSALMQIVVEKEQAIRARHEEILAEIDNEIVTNQNGKTFAYAHPTLSSVTTTSRLDTGLYCEGFAKFKHRIENYKHGATTLGVLGVKSRRGPNLAVSVIGKSLYSEVKEPGWYELIRPVNIGEYGTLTQQEWLGSPKNLPTLNPGDIVLGCEGFEKGRSIVAVASRDRCTTNFHGTVLYWPSAQIKAVCFLRCYLAYLRDKGVVDWVGVGGSGGHMSPTYFEYLPIPRIPAPRQEAIAKLYHNPKASHLKAIPLTSAVQDHRKRNKNLGILELENDIRCIGDELNLTRDAIIKGEFVQLPKSIGEIIS